MYKFVFGTRVLWVIVTRVPQRRFNNSAWKRREVNEEDSKCDNNGADGYYGGVFVCGLQGKQYAKARRRGKTRRQQRGERISQRGRIATGKRKKPYANVDKRVSKVAPRG